MQEPSLAHLLLDPTIAEIMTQREPGLRRFVLRSMEAGMVIPAMSSALAYYDSLRQALLPTAQYVQAQRDCFGGHGFERLDKPGAFHANWWASPVKPTPPPPPRRSKRATD